MRTKKLGCAATAALAISIVSQSNADPPIDVDAPPVFCFRITDIERCPDDISGSAFILEFEVLNWTDTPACGLTLNGNLGVFMWWRFFAPPWFNGVPLLTKANVDADGRGGPLGGNDIGTGVFDAQAIHSGRGRSDIGGHLNDWSVVPVGTGLTGHYLVTWAAPGIPADETSCIPDRDILDRFNELPDLDPNDPDDVLVINEILAASWAKVPGIGTDALGDSAVDGGPLPYTEADPPPPFRTGGQPIPDGSGNVLDGFVIEVCDWHPGEILAFNWWLLDKDLMPINHQGGFGTIALIRLPPGALPPVGAPFAGNAGFTAGGVCFYDSVWQVPAGLGPVGHAAADFGIELGAGLVAPEIPGDANPFDMLPNTVVTWSEFHECLPAELACPADINGDGAADIQDLLKLLSAWGSDCPLP